MQIEEVITRKAALAGKIQKLVDDFNVETGLITYSCSLEYRDIIGANRALYGVTLTVELP